ncbi:MAG: galactose mutarotase [Streptococcaceae bacterium]|jgi:aldose 1-epimerase|nr:galactose mutarotase [Streptococcaceae bacterium]
MTTSLTDFGDGYQLITLENSRGLRLSCTDFGARLTSLTKNGRELVLGFDQASDYQQELGDAIYYGAIVGRVAGRISGAEADISGQRYKLTANEKGRNTLHGGGENGLHDKKWEVELGDNQVIFTTTLADGLHGFPGNVAVKVIYFLNDEDEWGYEILATSDQDTLWNPCHHVYFNLTGDVSQPLDHHKLWLNASHYEPLKEGLPSFTKADVTGTALDFTKEKAIGDALHSLDKQITENNGIDHPFFLDDQQGVQARLISPDGQLSVELSTNQPSVVIFTANFGDNTPIARGNRLAHQGALTFETQVAPGAEQNASFGTLLLKAGEPYYNQTIFKINSLK